MWSRRRMSVRVPHASAAFCESPCFPRYTYVIEALPACPLVSFLLFASSMTASSPFRFSTTFFSLIILSKSLFATNSSFLRSSVWRLLIVSGAATAIVGKHAEKAESEIPLSVACNADAWTSCNRMARGPGWRGTGACGGGEGDGEAGVLVAIDAFDCADYLQAIHRSDVVTAWIDYQLCAWSLRFMVFTGASITGPVFGLTRTVGPNYHLLATCMFRCSSILRYIITS
jgi:hypothetical protein